MTKYSIIILALLALVWGVEGISDAANLTAPLTNQNVKVEQAYSPSNPTDFQQWTTIAAPTNTPDRLTHATVYDPVGDKIYMIGGSPNGQLGTNVSLCQQYDLVTNTWTDKTPMPTPRGWIYGSLVRGIIYCIGGYSNAGSFLNVNEAYTIATNSWVTKAPSPRIRAADLEVVWRDSLIYVMGGATMSTLLNNVDIYDPFTNTWSTGTPLPLTAYMGSAAIIGDTIYIANAAVDSTAFPNLYKGAINPTNPTEITWIPGLVLSQPVAVGGTATLDGNIYWLGGLINASVVTNTCWKYDQLTGTISTVVPYPQTLARCNYMVARPSSHELYVIAGDAGGDWNPPNNAYYKISYAPNDIGVDTIIAPGSTHPPNTVMTPIARVKNYGTVAQTNFQVICSIIGPAKVVRYTNTKTVASLAPGDSYIVNFDTWTPTDVEQESVFMRTKLTGDENPANDRKSRATQIVLIYLSESFTDPIFPPSGWTVYNFDGGIQQWMRWPTTPYSLPACAACRWENATLANNDWLITPRIGPVGASDSLVFYYRNYSTIYLDSMRVKVSTGTDVSDTAQYVMVDLIQTNTNAWIRKSLSLGQFAGNRVYIAFQYVGTDEYRMAIDDIDVRALGIAEESPNNNKILVTVLNAPTPNPVTNGLAKISFTISEPTKASLRIYDASGRIVRTLVNSQLERGVYNLNWNGTDDHNNNVAEGIYFYTLQTDKQTFTKKLILTR